MQGKSAAYGGLGEFLSSLGEVGGWVCRKDAGVVWGNVILCFLGLYLGGPVVALGVEEIWGRMDGCLSDKIIKGIGELLVER